MDGRVAIVTGGAQGIGKEYVEVLLSRQFKICIVDIDTLKGTETVAELQSTYPGCDVMFVYCDVTNNDQLESVFSQTLKAFGRLDVLVNNAGILNERHEALTLAINLIATIRGILIALGHMSKSSGGHGGVIVNIGSISGLQTSSICPLYAASKHGVVGFTRAIGATSFEEHGVRINCICPSYTETDMVKKMEESRVYGPKEKINEYFQLLSNVEMLSPKTVAACLNPLLDDVTLSGGAMLCSVEHPRALLELPVNLSDVHEMYVKERSVT